MTESEFFPLAEVDLQVGDVAIKFENDEDKEEFDEGGCKYESELQKSKEEIENLNIITSAEDYEDVNFHFLSESDANEGSQDSQKRLCCNEWGKYLDESEPMKNNLKMHVLSDRNQGKEKIYKCDFCDKQFTRSYNLKAHLKVHSNESAYVCDICQASFAKSTDLSRHTEYIHGSVTTFFTCEECGIKFCRKHHLQVHLNTHKSRSLQISPDNVANLIKAFTCEGCGKTFSRPDNLKRHLLKHCHRSDKPLSSEQPEVKEKSFIEKTFKDIDYHFLSSKAAEPQVVTSLRPFACEYCGRLFMRKDHLKNHERTHTGERPFQCYQCDRRFAKRFVMTRHLQNVHHVNAKVHQCTECERKFARSDHLKTHMKIHLLASMRNQNKDKSHKCEICYKAFTRSDNLKTHMKIHMLAEVKRQQEESVREDESVNAENLNYKREANYFCETCEKSFPDVEKLQKHEETHYKNSKKR